MRFYSFHYESENHRCIAVIFFDLRKCLSCVLIARTFSVQRVSSTYSEIARHACSEYGQKKHY